MDLLLLHFKQFLQKKSAISYLQNWTINLVFLSLVYSSTNKGKTGKPNTSVVHGLHTSQLFCYSRQKFGLSISAGSFIALNSQSNAIGSRKNEPVWCSRHILDAMFCTRAWSQASFTRSQSSSTSLFCHTNIRESCRLFYVCMGVFFLNPKINSMHISYMYERCKMFVLFELYWNRSLNVILKKFENAVLSLWWNGNKIRWCK